ncbi:MAG: ABC transporter ATP-binding protein [Alphaproteobacteria bacterium]|nr:ABC transporter ATP-binding protein [Alphaproteobacteria bacterium]
MPEPLLAVRDVSKTYRVGRTEVAALRDVGLELHKGECLALVGESGSGKTTLGKLILGIEAPSAGTLHFAGERLPDRRARTLRRRLQFVQQNPMSALNPKRTIGDSIALPLAVHGLVPRARLRARAGELLGLVGMSADLLDRYPAMLSGGQRQRVALARALAAEPDCIVLDEPTSSLDVSVQARILQLLADLQARLGLSYIFITHDLGVVRNIAHRVVVLYRGRVVETGTTAAMFGRPRHRYTQMLLSSIPVVSDEEERLKPSWPWERDVAAAEVAAAVGCAFAPRCAYALDVCRREAPAFHPVSSGDGHACHCPG